MLLLIFYAEEFTAPLHTKQIIMIFINLHYFLQLFNNQQLLYKITSGLNVKANTISGAVSAVVNDYANLKNTTTGIATTLVDLSVNTQNAFNALSTAETGVIDTRINAVSTVIQNQVTDAFGEGAKVIVSKDGGITKSQAIIGGATLADTALSTTLATEAAVRNAIDTKAISLVGKDAIGVSGDLNKTAYLTIDSNDKVLTQSADGLLTNIALSAIDPTTSAYVKSYCLVGVNGQKLGDTVIDIPKDRFIKSITYDETTQTLTIVYVTASGTEESVTISLKGLVDVYQGASGVTKVTNPETSAVTFIGVVDSNSEEYLTVGADGFKLSGVNTAINTAVNNARTDLSAYVDAETTARETAVSEARTDLSAYVDAETTARETAVSEARTDLSAYVDAETTARETAVSEARTDLSAYVEAASGNAYAYTDSSVTSARTDLSAYVDAETTARETAVSETRTDLSAYVEAASGNVKTYADDTFVTKTVFGDIASNTKADNEVLATKYEDLETKLSTLLENI